MQSYSLSELAALSGARVQGDKDLIVRGIRPLDAAGPGDLTLALDSRRLEQAHARGAAAVIIPATIAAEGQEGGSYIVSDNPKLAWAAALGLFGEATWRPRGISPRAAIDPSALLGEGVAVGALAFVGPEAVIGEGTVLYPGVYIGSGVRIGRGCVISANVTIGDRCVLGNEIVLHSGVVVGADGFGTVFDGKRHRKIPQIGNVIIGDDVEIGANSCIDRATVGSTRIGSNSKIDNLVQIGHNVQIGEQVLISGKVGISGSAKIGPRAVLAGEAAVVDHAVIGEGAILMARAVAVTEVPAGAQVLGFPAREHREELRTQAAIRRLPDLLKQVRRLEQRLAELEDESGE